jgi:predicted transcriptional regulator
MPPSRVTQSPSTDESKSVKNSRDVLRTDVVLAMNQPYMEQIVSGLKTFEFRKYRIAENVQRVWFYITAPESRISHICDIAAARTPTEGDEPLPLNGLGNKEFNERHADWDGYDYAYVIKAVYQLTVPIELKVMKEKYGWKGAPRGLVYVSPEMAQAFPLEDQIKILPKEKKIN